MNTEKGQALPIAMLALAIGSLVVIPFVSYAGTSLISSRTLGEVIAEQSASDAGVEHAIWSLTRGTLATQFTQSGDQVTYALGETLNGYNTSITVTANQTAVTSGMIEDIVKDTLDFDTTSCYLPSMIMVSTNVCAVAYRGNSNNGYVRTASIDANGNISNAYIDTLTFVAGNCYEPSIVNVSGTTYAIAYRGASNYGYVRTMSIDANGNISNAYIATLTFVSGNCYEPYIVNVSGTTFAIVYRGASNYGYIRTVSIPASGTPITAIATRTFISAVCYEPEITRVSSNIYAIAFRGASNYGYLRTISIAANGTIGAATIGSLTFDSSACYTPSLIQVSSSTYAVAYQGSSTRGFLKTASISADGTIGSVLDTLIFDATLCNEPDIVYVSSDVFAIAYRQSSNHGLLKTMTINTSGAIGDSVIDTLDSIASGYEPSIVKVSGNIFAIAYRGSSNDGFISTVGITTGATASAAWEIISTAGNTSIRAYVNTTNTTSTIISWYIE
jgi:hypothetical protein